MTWRNHTLRTVSRSGDLFVAYCVGCDWVSEGFDVKNDARRAHAEHVLSERLKGAAR